MNPSRYRWPQIRNSILDYQSQMSMVKISIYCQGSLRVNMYSSEIKEISWLEVLPDISKFHFSYIISKF